MSGDHLDVYFQSGGPESTVLEVELWMGLVILSSGYIKQLSVVPWRLNRMDPSILQVTLSMAKS